MSTPSAKRRPLSVRELALFGVLGAVTFGAKVVMSFLPNIEPVSLFVMLFAVVFGARCLYPIYTYVLLEILIYGPGTWNLMYLYIWAILAGLAWLLRKQESPLVWALLSGFFGLCFGALCAPVDFLMGDWAYVFSKWVSGLIFDVYHCLGNFTIALLLFVPLRKLLTKLYHQSRR